MDFSIVEKRLRLMGEDCGAYRKLNLGFIEYNNKPYRIRDIFNIHPYNKLFKTNPFNMNNMFNAAIAYLGTYLSKYNYTFEYIISFNEEKEKLVDLLNKESILCIAIITTFYMDIFPVLEIIQFIKKYNKDIKIILGGPFIWIKARDLSKEKLNRMFKILGADIYVNSHQGEAALINILSAIKYNKPLNDIKNIYFFGNDHFIATDTVVEDNKLEENIINWNLFSGRIKNIVPIRTSSSCCFRCSFCSYPLNKIRYQELSVEHIEKELRSLSRINKNLHLSFIDDTFNFPKKRFVEFLKMMRKNKFSFTWDSNIRCQYLDKETVKMMFECGCKGVYLGIESGNQTLLNNMNKKAKISDLVQGIDLLNQFRILSCASFIIGFPGETIETAECTRQFIEKYKPAFYQLHIWYYEPYTPVWQQKHKYNLSGSHLNWKHRTMDVSEAFNIIDNMFKSIENSIWLPQNDFEYYGIFELLKRNISLEKIKKFFYAFNRDVKRKIEKLSPVYDSLKNPF